VTLVNGADVSDSAIVEVFVCGEERKGKRKRTARFPRVSFCFPLCVSQKGSLLTNAVMMHVS
jgi:hypothetical protein